MYGMPPVRRAGKAGIKSARRETGAAVYVIYTFTALHSISHHAAICKKNFK